MRIIKVIAPWKAATATTQAHDTTRGPDDDPDQWVAWYVEKSGWIGSRDFATVDDAREKLAGCPDNAAGKTFRAQLEARMRSAEGDQVRSFDHIELDETDLKLRSSLEQVAQELAARSAVLGLVVGELEVHAQETHGLTVQRLIELRARVRADGIAIPTTTHYDVEYPAPCYDRSDCEEEDEVGIHRSWVKGEDIDMFLPGAWERIYSLVEAIYANVPLHADGDPSAR